MTHIVRIVSNRDLLLFQFWMIEKHISSGPVENIVHLDSCPWHQLRCSLSGTGKRQLEKIIVVLNPLLGTRARSEEARFKHLFWRLFQRSMLDGIVHFVSPAAERCIQRSEPPNGMLAW